VPDQPDPPDQLARNGAVAIAIGRLGIGLAMSSSPRRALTGLGFGDPQPATVALARMAGVRDIAMALHALGVRDHRAGLRAASLIGAGVDAGDAIALGALIGTDRRTALTNAPLGAVAAVLGALVARRLS
jgi:hypothetical protein